MSYPRGTPVCRVDATALRLRGGSLFAGAKVPSMAVADKLVAAFKNDKAKPVVFCHEPSATARGGSNFSAPSPE